MNYELCKLNKNVCHAEPAKHLVRLGLRYSTLNKMLRRLSMTDGELEPYLVNCLLRAKKARIILRSQQWAASSTQTNS